MHCVDSFSSPLHQFESDLQKMKIERLRSFKAMEDYMESFERKRTQDLKVGGAHIHYWHVHVFASQNLWHIWYIHTAQLD